MKYSYSEILYTTPTGEVLTGHCYFFPGRVAKDELINKIAYDPIVPGSVEIRHPNINTLQVTLWINQRLRINQQKQLFNLVKQYSKETYFSPFLHRTV